jgi:hypothetical protein
MKSVLSVLVFLFVLGYVGAASFFLVNKSVNDEHSNIRLIAQAWQRVREFEQKDILALANEIKN